MRTEKKTFLGFHLFVCFSPSYQNLFLLKLFSSPYGLTISVYRLFQVLGNYVTRRPSVRGVMPFFSPLTLPPILLLNVRGWTEDDDGELQTLVSFSYGPDCSGVLIPLPLPQLPRTALLISSLPRRTAHFHPSKKQGKTKQHREVRGGCILWACIVGRGEGEASLSFCAVNCTNNINTCSLSLVSNLFSSRFINDYYKPPATWKRPKKTEEQNSQEEIFPFFYHFLILCVCEKERVWVEGRKRIQTRKGNYTMIWGNSQRKVNASHKKQKGSEDTEKKNSQAVYIYHPS